MEQVNKEQEVEQKGEMHTRFQGASAFAQHPDVVARETVKARGGDAGTEPTQPGKSEKLPEQQQEKISNKWKDKTTGEKWFAVGRFLVGKAWIMVFTAAIAYVAKHGKDEYRGIPNYIKQFQGWLQDTVKVKERTGFPQLLAGAFASTMVLFHGGNIFAPVMKWMENSKEKVVTAINKRWGKEGEVERGHERLKDEPKQGWGDVFKGRVAAWAIVFTSFMAAYVVIGKHKETRSYHLDRYEEWFGRKLGNIHSWLQGKEAIFPKLSILAELPKGGELETDKWYRFGKICALDVYATSAAIAIWTFISRISARKKQDAKNQADAHPSAEPALSLADKDVAQAKQSEGFPSIQPRAAQGYASMVSQPTQPIAGIGA